MLLLADVGEDFPGGILNIHRRKVYPRGKDAFDRCFAELKRGGNELAAFLAQAAVLGHVLNDIIDLVLGDGYLGVCLYEACRKVAD